jgi:hypothetical protein
MRAFIASVIAIILAAAISLNTIRILSFSEVGPFLIIITVLYGIVVSFTISNAWERFSKIRDTVSQEMNSLITAHAYAKQISDRDAAQKLQEGIVAYCDEVPQVDWHKYWESEETHKKFRRLFDVLAAAKLKSPKDVELFNEASHELRDASHARTTQMLLAQTRISKTQWALNLFLSGVLIGCVALLAVASYWTAALLTSVIIVTVVSMLFIIHELDTMQFAEREIGCEPYAQVMRIVSSGAINPDLELWYQDKSAIRPPEVPQK